MTDLSTLMHRLPKHEAPAFVRHVDGWTPYMFQVPDSDLLLCFWNEYNGQKWTGYARDIHPMANVAYLWWKLTGIEREKCKN